MFRTVPLSIIRSFFTVHTATVYVIPKFHKWVELSVWHIPLLCVQWKTPDDGQRNCSKHVAFCAENKFEKLAHQVDCIIRIFITLHCQLIVKFVRNHIKYTNIKARAGHLQKKYTLQVKNSENVYAELILPHPFQIPFTNKSVASHHLTQPDTQLSQYSYKILHVQPLDQPHTCLFQMWSLLILILCFRAS